MRIWIFGAAAALAASAALAQQAASPAPTATQTVVQSAAPPAPPPARRHAPSPPEGWTQLFMSPCGEPWRAGPGEPYPVKAWFDAADANHDGAIDPEELRGDFGWFFDALDQDRNGFLDGAEVSFYENRVAPDVLLGQLIADLDVPRAPPGLWGGSVVRAQLGTLGGGQVYSPNGAQGPAPDLGSARRSNAPLVGAAAYALLNDAEPVKSADTNLDGRITRAEFLAAADRRFKRLDRNGDGKVTMAELPRPPAQQVAEAQGRRRR